MLALTHCTPCQPSVHGSPPACTHPIRGGVPRAPYKLLIAATEIEWTTGRESTELPWPSHFRYYYNTSN